MARKKETSYFDMFAEAAQYACGTARLLMDLICDFTDVERKVHDIHAEEHKADGVFRKVAQQLNQSFITPIERDDILHIAQAIDDVVDMVDEVAISFYMLNVTVVRPDAKAFAEYIERACVALCKAMEEFKHFKKSKNIQNLVVEISDIEDEADAYYQKAVRNLYMTTEDPIEIQKWREIYAHMENSLDACENVADMLETVMLKNS